MKRREWTLVGACGDTTWAILPPPGGGFAGVGCTLADGLGAVVAMFGLTTRLRPVFRSGSETGCRHPGRRPGCVTRELPAADSAPAPPSLATARRVVALPAIANRQSMGESASAPIRTKPPQRAARRRSLRAP